MAIIEGLERPIVAAPMGGGPSTPELVAAVGGAGGIGFLAAGYRSATALGEEIEATAALCPSFGVNLFVPGAPARDRALDRYLTSLAAEAERYGTSVGVPRFDDDDWEAKLDVVRSRPPAVVSFTFGCPPAGVVAALQESGVEVWATVTGVAEAEAALAAGADALVAQGHEAGAHQGAFDDAAAPEPLGLLALLQLLAAHTELPLVAAGGIATGAGLAAALAAGAGAAQIGTAFLLCPEAGTSEVHRESLRAGDTTRLTRAFTGRRARGLENRFLREHDGAPSAYPEIHHATAPIRAAAREAGDPEAVNLWAGQAVALAREAEPAAAVVERIDAEARAILSRLGRG